MDISTDQSNREGLYYCYGEWRGRPSLRISIYSVKCKTIATVLHRLVQFALTSIALTQALSTIEVKCILSTPFVTFTVTGTS